METLQSSNNISFNTLGKRPRFDKLKTSNWLKRVADKEARIIESLSYNLCSDEYLLEMNIEHLGHNYYTDIITFDLSDAPSIVEGDLYISVDRVKDNAKTLGVTFEDEFRRVLVHGLLHLIGYGDKTNKEIIEMRSKEALYLASY